MGIPLSRCLECSEVPVIDVGPLLAGEDHQPTVTALGSACSDVGFFYVCNHGVEPGLVERLHEQAIAFFAHPMEQKMQLLVDERLLGYLPLGYRSYEGESHAATSNQEGFWVGHDRPLNGSSPLDGPNRWPADPLGLQSAMLDYFAATSQLSRALLRGFALALEVPADTFLKLFERPLSRLKLNHYPPQDTPEHVSNIGVVPHSDSGGFTILWQDDNGGLEIQGKNGDWVGAPPVDDTFVVNIGNVMQLWTGGRFSSTPHRVINRGGVDRYSIPHFVNPDSDAMIQPLAGNAGKPFDPFYYGEYQRAVWRRTFPVAQIPECPETGPMPDVPAGTFT